MKRREITLSEKLLYVPLFLYFTVLDRAILIFVISHPREEKANVCHLLPLERSGEAKPFFTLLGQGNRNVWPGSCIIAKQHTCAYYWLVQKNITH